MHTENGLNVRGEQLNGVNRLHAHSSVELGHLDYVQEVVIELESLSVGERVWRVQCSIDSLQVVACLLILLLINLLEPVEALVQHVVGVVDQVVEELEKERLLAVIDVRVRLVRQCAHLPPMLVEQTGCVVGNITPVTNTTKSVAHIPKEIDQLVDGSTVADLLEQIGMAAHLDAHEHIEQRLAETRGLRLSRECLHGQRSQVHLSADLHLETLDEFSATMRIEEAVGVAYVGDRERDESI